MTSFLFAAPAGSGAMVAGRLFSKFCQRSGFGVFSNNEYPSLVRGGVNFYEVNFGDSVCCLSDFVDVLVALNKDCFDSCKFRLKKGGFVVFDCDVFELKGENCFGVPLGSLSEGLGNVRNVVALGAGLALFGFDLALFYSVIEDVFKHKGDVVVENNKKALRAGFDFFKENFNACLNVGLPSVKEESVFVSGNEAVALGALQAGLKFFCAYPMTPASGVLHFLAAKEREAGIVVKHVEDELAVLNMALGASFAGVRSMVATSGGGFCLMSEALGLSGMAEVPVVIVVAMRQGPSTGVPTRTSQGDLAFSVFASHGQFPRVVLAPGDVEELFYFTFDAFELAYKFQVPVIVLSDKFLAESFCSIKPFDTSLKPKNFFVSEAEPGFKRYLFTEDGVSPMSRPGVKDGEFVASSYEHDEFGHTVEDAESIKKMTDKRFAKLVSLKKSIPKPVLYGDEDADVTIVGWGSSKSVVLEALKILKQKGVSANFLHFVFVEPFPVGFVKSVLSRSKNVVLVEASKLGFLADLIRMRTGFVIENKVLKYDGLPFFPKDVVDGVLRFVK